MKMYTFLELRSISKDGEPSGVAVACADSKAAAMLTVVNVCRGWRPEAADALRQELKKAMLITDVVPYAFLSSTGGADD